MIKKSEMLQLLGQRIKYYRELKGLTLNQMSELTGIKKNYLKRIDKGNASSVSILHLVKMSEVLDISVYDFIVEIEKCVLSK